MQTRQNECGQGQWDAALRVDVISLAVLNIQKRRNRHQPEGYCLMPAVRSDSCRGGPPGHCGNAWPEAQPQPRLTHASRRHPDDFAAEAPPAAARCCRPPHPPREQRGSGFKVLPTHPSGTSSSEGGAPSDPSALTPQPMQLLEGTRLIGFDQLSP